MVGVAARVWQHASMAESTRSALAKLRAAGRRAGHLPARRARTVGAGPRGGVRAAVDRGAGSRPGVFTYREGDRRTLEPWGMTASKGRWYVIGWDTDRQATRMFKLTRITDKPRRVSKVGRVPGARRPRPAFPGPLAGSPGAHPARPWSPSDRARVRPCVAAATPAEALGSLPAGFEVLSGFETYGRLLRPALVEEIARYAADVVVLDPPELRDAVLDVLRRVAALRDERRPGSAEPTRRSWSPRRPPDRRCGMMTSRAQVRRLLALVPVPA